MSIKYGYEINLNSDSTAAKIVKLVGENKNVLEFGCSYGYMSQILIDKFRCTVTGIEIDKEAAKIASKICKKVIIGNAEEINLNEELNNEKFDVIIFGDVLEHLTNPWELLEKVRLFLEDDGYIIASMPNISYMAVILDLIEGNFQYRPLGILDNTHLRHFTKNSMIDMFESSGYYVDLVQKTKIPVNISEFKIDINSVDSEIIKKIKSKNDEWDTYQFIMRAYKSGENSRIKILTEKISILQEELKKCIILSDENKRLKEYIDLKEEEIKDITNYVRKLECDIIEVKECTEMIRLEKDRYLNEMNEIKKSSLLYSLLKKLK